MDTLFLPYRLSQSLHFFVDVLGTLSLILKADAGIQECCGMSYSALASSLARLASPHTEATIGKEAMVL
jgi:hypothetical protein